MTTNGDKTPRSGVAENGGFAIPPNRIVWEQCLKCTFAAMRISDVLHFRRAGTRQRRVRDQCSISGSIDSSAIGFEPVRARWRLGDPASTVRCQMSHVIAVPEMLATGARNLA